VVWVAMSFLAAESLVVMMASKGEIFQQGSPGPLASAYMGEGKQKTSLPNVAEDLPVARQQGAPRSSGEDMVL